MRECCVLGCDSRSSKEKGISLHSFPTEKTKRDLWLSVVPLKKKSKCPMICSLHFTDNDYKSSSGVSRPLLNLEAVPSLFLNQKSESNERSDCYGGIEEPQRRTRTQFEELDFMKTVNTISESQEKILSVSKKGKQKKDVGSKMLICRGCLAVDIKMFDMSEYKLTNIYLYTMDLEEIEVSRLPRYLCVWCATRLASYARFKKHCDLSRTLLTQVLENGEEITYDAVKVLCESTEYSRPLHMTLEKHTPDTSNETHLDHDSLVLYERVNDEANLRPEKTENFENGIFFEEPIEEIDFISEDIKHCSEDEVKMNNEDVDSETEEINELNQTKSKKPKDNERVYIKSKKSLKKDVAKVSRKLTEKLSSKSSKSRMTVKKNFTLLSSDNWAITELSKEEQLERFFEKQNCDRFANAPYRCAMCLRGFAEEKMYLEHQRHHDKEWGRYECQVCKMRFKMWSRKVTHERLHTYKFTCKHCPYVTNTEGNARLHDKYHAGVTFNCADCNLSFKKQSTYLTHRRVHHRSQFVCRVCGENFLTALAVKAHHTRQHPEVSVESITEECEGSVFCELCQVRFLTGDAFARHKLSSDKHAGERGAVTDRLLKVRMYYARMNRENAVFLRQSRSSRARGGQSGGQRDHKIPTGCPECGDTFSSEIEYRRHHRARHPGTRLAYRHMCDACGVTFACLSQLREHKLVHSGERPYACSQCPRAFNNKRNLARHVASHSGERPYACEECGKRFTAKATVKLHHRHVHLKERWARRDRHRTQHPHPAAQVTSSAPQFLNALRAYSSDGIAH